MDASAALWNREDEDELINIHELCGQGMTSDLAALLREQVTHKRRYDLESCRRRGDADGRRVDATRPSASSVYVNHASPLADSAPWPSRRRRCLTPSVGDKPLSSGAFGADKSTGESWSVEPQDSNLLFSYKVAVNDFQRISNVCFSDGRILAADLATSVEQGEEVSRWVGQSMSRVAENRGGEEGNTVWSCVQVGYIDQGKCIQWPCIAKYRKYELNMIGHGMGMTLKSFPFCMSYPNHLYYTTCDRILFLLKAHGFYSNPWPLVDLWPQSSRSTVFEKPQNVCLLPVFLVPVSHFRKFEKVERVEK